MEERFDIVDDNDRVIGQALRAEAHIHSLKHRAIHVLVFDAQGNLFVQKRAGTKDTFPHRYDSSASGHLDRGEDYDTCAARELQEELGLSVPPRELQKLFKITACAQTGWEFVWVYRLQGDYQPRINPAELADGAFWPVARIISTIAANPEAFTPSFIRVTEECRDRRLWPT
jgi:isopentenyl-diphosphate delta-isomerase type 1